MDNQKVEMWLMTNKKYFPAKSMACLKEKLLETNEEKFDYISMMEFKEPTTLLLLSLLLGGWGVDRFMLGDTGMGVFKLLTGGCCGVLTIVDWFTIQNKAREKNFRAVMSLL